MKYRPCVCPDMLFKESSGKNSGIQYWNVQLKAKIDIFLFTLKEFLLNTR